MEHKNLLLALWGIAGLLVWLADFFRVFKKPEFRFPKVKTSKLLYAFRFLTLSMGIAGWLLIAYSLTGPRKALKFLPDTIEVNDIIIVLDVSKSMLANDLTPNRLEVAKKRLREFAAMKPKDRIGVVIFSERVFTLLPPTTDPKLVDRMISEIETGGFLGAGTNIGDALALGVARADQSETKNKVIVLLTDGVSNVGNMTPIQAAEVAKEFKIKVYTIAIGTNHDAKIPIGKGLFGTQFQTIPGGSFDTKTLKQISDMTGGRTYLADSSDAFKQILDEIELLERTKIKNSNQVVYDELYFEFLLYGIILLFASELLRRFAIREVI